MNPVQKHIETIGAMSLNATEAGSIMRKSRITGGRKLQEIRDFLGKPYKGYITVKEFSVYTGVPIEVCVLYCTVKND